jgi:elongation factor P
MAYVMAGDFRKGVTFEKDGQIVQIVEFLHVKPGKGAAFVRAKYKNVITGSVIEATFNPTEKFELARIERKKMQYLYNEGDMYYFMDNETYEQVPLNKGMVEDALNFVKENMEVDIAFYNGSAIFVEAPNFVELVITHCEPGAKGNTAQNTTKPATLETGYVVQVPLFVNEGETIRVDTRTGQYMSRA